MEVQLMQSSAKPVQLIQVTDARDAFFDKDGNGEINVADLR
jgi:hypothetical protein